MNFIRSSIHMIPAIDFRAGRCCVCGEDAILKWVDCELPGGGFLGNCCFASVMSADRVLILNNPARPTEKTPQ